MSHDAVTSKKRITSPESSQNDPVNTSLKLGWLSDAIAHRLRIAQELCFQHYKDNLREFSFLHPGHFTALTVIAENPGCNQTELGHAIGRDKSTLTPLLQRLSKEELLLRKRRPDNQRTYSLTLTPKGEAMLKSLERVGKEQEQALSTLFTPDEKSALLDYLNRIATLAQKT
ncbi:MarR family winged helix-turn-helix transcriptional regulator [Serratia sp. NPDC078593]|uniref:MarR family winged helix-turn-helix transcriptional regulator n=1 Tax=unclassified Serratia (in: enterobacteria) TaxID=2647522 RepID=UPI0037D2236E